MSSAEKITIQQKPPAAKGRGRQRRRGPRQPAAATVRTQPSGPRPVSAHVAGSDATRQPRAPAAARANPVGRGDPLAALSAQDNASAAAALYQEVCPEDDNLNVGLAGSGELVGTSVGRGEVRVPAVFKYCSHTGATYAVCQFQPSLTKTVMTIGTGSSFSSGTSELADPTSGSAMAWTGVGTFVPLAGALELIDFDQITAMRGQVFYGLLTTPMWNYTEGASPPTAPVYSVETPTLYGNGLTWTALADVKDSSIAVPWAPPTLSDRQARPRAWDYANSEFTNTCGMLPTIIIKLAGDVTSSPPQVTFRARIRAQISILPTSTVGSTIALWTGGGNNVVVPSESAYSLLNNKLTSMASGITVRNAASASEWKTLKNAARRLFKEFTTLARPLAKRSIMGAVAGLLNPIFGAEADALHALQVLHVPPGTYTPVECARLLVGCPPAHHRVLTDEEVDTGRAYLADAREGRLPEVLARHMRQPGPSRPPSEADHFEVVPRAARRV